MGGRMTRRAGAVFALGLAVAGSNVHAQAPPSEAVPGGGMRSLAPILKKITPAVVSIETKPRPVASARNRRPDTARLGNIGSGVVYDAKRGLIVTNNHVIENSDDMTVTLTDGRSFKAKRVGGDPDFDLAVVSVPTDSLPAIAFGDSRQLEVGDFVLAIGYPANMGQSVTSGIVSGLHRTNVGLEQFENFIQTDAAIYPGNSGGALVDLQGGLVGINTAYIGATAANPGMGFAIPVNMARIIADQIVEFGDIRRGSIGITIDDPPAPASGAVIVKVTPGSPGARAGLKAGDVVTDIGNRPVNNGGFLRNRLALFRVGEVADLTVMRDGKPQKIQVTVGDREQPRTRGR
jgi:S1-C subfamily serine protease